MTVSVTIGKASLNLDKEKKKCAVIGLFKMFLERIQGVPGGLLSNGLQGRKWKGLAGWFMSPKPIDPGLK